jgi:hypothetical protein
VGKSTFARTYLSSFPYINGDEIERQAELSGQRIDSFGLRTAVQSKINNHISNKESFALESNLVDNSVQGIDPTEVLELKKGIIEWRKDPLPFWLNNIFPIIEKLSKACSKMNLR